MTPEQINAAVAKVAAHHCDLCKRGHKPTKSTEGLWFHDGGEERWTFRCDAATAFALAEELKGAKTK